MKLLLALMLLSVNVAFSNYSYGQHTRLSMDVRNKKVVDILDLIEKQSEFRFFYNGEMVDIARNVSVKAYRQSVFVILDELFRQSGVGYKVVDKDIILMPLSAAAREAKITALVSGTVTDQTSGELSPVLA